MILGEKVSEPTIINTFHRIKWYTLKLFQHHHIQKTKRFQQELEMVLNLSATSNVRNSKILTKQIDNKKIIIVIL